MIKNIIKLTILFTPILWLLCFTISFVFLETKFQVEFYLITTFVSIFLASLTSVYIKKEKFQNSNLSIHDLKNSIHGININIELLKSTMNDCSEDQEKMFDKHSRYITKINELLNQSDHK